MLVFGLGSCSVCVRVRAGMCQLWDCSCSPPGAAWSVPALLLRISNVSVITSASLSVQQRNLCFPGNGTRGWQFRLGSSQGSAAAPEAAGPRSCAGLGQENLQRAASGDLSPAALGVAPLENILGLLLGLLLPRALGWPWAGGATPGVFLVPAHLAGPAPLPTWGAPLAPWGPQGLPVDGAEPSSSKTRRSFPLNGECPAWRWL